MKITTVVSASLVAVASAATCDYAVVGPNLQSLGKPIASCMTATGNSYNLARAPAPPTAEQAAAICAKCPDFVAAVTALPPWPDCTMNVGGSEQTLTSYFDKMIGGCKSSSGASGASSTGSNATTTQAPAATTTATAAASAGSTAGSAAAAKSENSTATSGEVMITTAPATTTSVPSPTSSGYSLRVGAVAAGAFATTMAIVF